MGTAGSGCSHDKAIGGCLVTSMANGVTISTTTWFYFGTLVSVKSGCAAAHGTFVSPSGGGNNQDGGMPMGSYTRYVVNHWTLPMQSSEDGWDLVGSGHRYNQFGNFIGAFSSQGFDLQDFA
jgi:hypothetical protein